jgi:ADP-dependent NAD(P)H-hydrate dehydratase / NAD(P)H-hydrate epimerase
MSTSNGTKLTRILEGSSMAKIDAEAIRGGIDSKLLMNNAGSSVSMEIISDFEHKELMRAARGVVICGSGNNAGDGLVAAGNLLDYGMKVTVFHIFPLAKFSSNSLFYFNKLEASRKDSIHNLDMEDSKTIAFFKEELGKADFLVDAIFGTGLHGNEIHGPSKEIIEIINFFKESNKNLKIYSVDIPSGVDSDNGSILGVSVRADKTITFACKKIGIVNYPGADFAGEVKVIDIGIPEKYYSGYEQIFEPDIKWVVENIPVREPWTYKYKVGSLLVIAGSSGFTGAASMTCMGALRAGAGVVTLVSPWGLNNIFEEKLTEVITYPVAQTEDVSLNINSLSEILDLSERFNAVVIGPGLSRNSSTMCLVRELLKNLKKPIVLDADGLYALYGANDTDIMESLDLTNVIITPHTGEMSLIMGLGKIPLEDRIRINLEAAEKYKLTSVLKGARTIVSDYNKKTFINPTGNWGLATAGTGDILTGIIGSLLSQGMGLMESAVCGAYIHGLAADIMVKETSRTSLIATDLLEGLKKVFLEIEKIKY